MAKQKPRTLSGFMELLPQRQVQFDRMVELLRRSYSLYGFTPLDTPVIEASEVLLAKAGGETEKQIYRFLKGDTDLSLRFDLTVPLAKYVALHYGELAFPFRRFQIGKVYRGERAQRGRFREFYQADIDIIGDGKLDIVNEAEIPSIIYQTFTSLGLKRFQIRVNNRKILNGFYAMLGLTDKSGDIMRTVDKLEKIGPEKVAALLTGEDIGITGEQAQEILKFIAIQGDNDQVLTDLEGYRGRHQLFDQGLDELTTVVKYLSAFGVPQTHFAVDLTIARGLDYYTGTVYETTPGDRLHLLRRPLRQPGRVLHRQAAARRGHLHRPDPAVLCAGGPGLPQRGDGHCPRRRAHSPHDPGPGPRHLLCHSAAQRGREGPTVHRTEEVQAEDELRRQDRRALIGVPYVAFLGDDEISQNAVSVKDMTTGQQETLPVDQAVDTIANDLAERVAGIDPIREP